MHWRRKWQLTPVFLPGESQGRGSLVGCCLWGHTESDTTEVTQQQQQRFPEAGSQPSSGVPGCWSPLLFLIPLHPVEVWGSPTDTQQALHYPPPPPNEVVTAQTRVTPPALGLPCSIPWSLFLVPSTPAQARLKIPASVLTGRPQFLEAPGLSAVLTHRRSLGNRVVGVHLLCSRVDRF